MKPVLQGLVAVADSVWSVVDATALAPQVDFEPEPVEFLAGVVAAYVIAVHVLPLIIRKPFTGPVVSSLVLAHNLLLSFVSTVLFFLLLAEVARDWLEGDSFATLFCDPGQKHRTGRRVTIYALNYYCKMYEFGDTFVYIIKKKPVIFLHWYHHAATLVLTWVQIYAWASVQWVPILLNLAVHSVMYLYYGISSRSKAVRSIRPFLTTFQIVQFVIDVVACVVATYLRLTHDSGRNPTYPACSGEIKAAYFGTGLLFSYFLLFIKFFIDNYGAKAKQVAPKAKKVQ